MKIGFIIILSFFSLLGLLRFSASVDNPEELIKEQIKNLDLQKVEKITTIKEKQEIDNLMLSGLIFEIKELEGKINRRRRCIDILSGSLGSINMIDCEEAMKSFPQE